MFVSPEKTCSKCNLGPTDQNLQKLLAVLFLLNTRIILHKLGGYFSRYRSFFSEWEFWYKMLLLKFLHVNIYFSLASYAINFYPPKLSLNEKRQLRNRKSFFKRCHRNKTLRQSQNSHTRKWTVQDLLGQPSGAVHLLWVLGASDLCSCSFSFLAKPCSLAVGSVIMLTTQTQAKSK